MVQLPRSFADPPLLWTDGRHDDSASLSSPSPTDEEPRIPQSGVQPQSGVRGPLHPPLDRSNPRSFTAPDRLGSTPRSFAAPDRLLEEELDAARRAAARRTSLSGPSDEERPGGVQPRSFTDDFPLLSSPSPTGLDRSNPRSFTAPEMGSLRLDSLAEEDGEEPRTSWPRSEVRFDGRDRVEGCRERIRAPYPASSRYPGSSPSETRRHAPASAGVWADPTARTSSKSLSRISIS